MFTLKLIIVIAGYNGFFLTHPHIEKTGIQHEIEHLEYEFEFESSKDGNTIEYLIGDGCFMISLGAKLTYPSCLANSRNP